MWRLILLSICATFFAASCDGDDPEPPKPVPSISPVSAPGFLLCNAESLYAFSVRVENLDNLDSVYCLVRRPDGSENAPFRLYDDGDVTDLNWPDYAGNRSGDIVPGNGTYTRTIRSNLLCAGEEGTYRFTFRAVGPAASLTTDPVEVDVRSPQACLFNSVEHPTSFAECFASTMISVTLSEDPEVPVDTLRVQWWSGDTLWWFADLVRGTGENWQLELAPSRFQCTPTGAHYSLRFEAYNAFGLSCSRTTNGLSFNNALPVVSNPQLADTLYRPVTPGDADTMQFFIRSDDCELVGSPWTQSVHFEVSRDDTLHWGSNSDFFLRDDGVPPDIAAGDGLASSYLVISHGDGSLVNNVYYFKYYSIECSSGDTSAALIDSTRIILSGGIATGGAHTRKLGISSYK